MIFLRFSLLVACSTITICAAATDYPTADHGGADFTLTNGDRIGGAHLNIGIFTLPAGAVVQVLPRDNITTDSGALAIVANVINIQGTLDGTGAGWPGGAGGAGGYGTSDFGQPGQPGQGPFPGHPYDGTAQACLAGGYMERYSNGDVTIDQTVNLGSGGAGGHGYQGQFYCLPYGCNNYYGLNGTPGGAGGGAIALIAGQQLSLGTNALIKSNGNAGTSSESYGVSWPSGAGAGGGILLEARDANSVTLTPGCAISSLGGSEGCTSCVASAHNGGTVKVFVGSATALSGSATITAGRIFSNSPGFTRRDIAVSTGNVIKPACRPAGSRPTACLPVVTVQLTNLGNVASAKGKLNLFLKSAADPAAPLLLVKRLKTPPVAAQTSAVIVQSLKIKSFNAGDWLVATLDYGKKPGDDDPTNDSLELEGYLSY